MRSLKFCKHCNVNLPIENFRVCRYSNGKEYLKSICKQSESVLQVNRVRMRGRTAEQIIKNKNYLKKYKKSAKYKNYIANNINLKLKKNISRQVLRSLEVKTCTNCKITKSIKLFGVRTRKLANNKNKTYSNIYCKSCEAKKTQKWRTNNPDKKYSAGKATPYSDRKQYYRNSYLKLKFEKKLVKVDWNKRKKYELIRKQSSNYKLREYISNSVRKAINNKNNITILKYLNYSIAELRSHIESQFEAWMNWSNRGHYKREEWDDNNPATWKWQLDHIIPQSDLPYDSMDHPNFKKCWALENLRPLSAKQNMIDGATRIRHKKVQ